MPQEVRLTNCLKIVGHGLNPLCGTLVLEEIDFNIVRLLDCGGRYGECISIELALAFVGDLLGRKESAFIKMSIHPDWVWDKEKEQLSGFIAGRDNAVLNEWALACYFGFDETKEQFVKDYLDKPTDDCYGCGLRDGYFSCVDCHLIRLLPRGWWS